MRSVREISNWGLAVTTNYLLTESKVSAGNLDLAVTTNYLLTESEISTGNLGLAVTTKYLLTESEVSTGNLGLAVTTKYLLTESEVCTGNWGLAVVTERQWGQYIQVEVRYSRKDRTCEVDKYSIVWYFSKNGNNTVQVVMRARRSLTIRNAHMRYGKSKPLRDQSERTKYFCPIINGYDETDCSIS